MLPKSAPLCAKCQIRHTLNPSGLCSDCRRTPKSHMCIICHNRMTPSPERVCAGCRRSFPTCDISKAIKQCALELSVLKLRNEGMSFRDIAKMTEKPFGTIYGIYERRTRIHFVPDVDSH